MKELLRRILHLLFTPLRQSYNKRNGAAPKEDRHELPNDIFLRLVSEKIAEGHTCTIWVKGNSMRPFIEQGRDKVTLARLETVGVGDAVLAQISPGNYVLHRIIHKDGNKLTLQGDGNVRGVERCLTGDVCGVVTEYIRPARTIPASDKRLRRRIRLWRRLRPQRRWLLFMYRAML